MSQCGCKTPPVRMRVADRSYFFSADKVGKNMSFTPEGFLLCEAVPIARIGEQLYGPDETPLKVGKDGLVHVQRDEKEVFRPETIASFEGKDVVDEHPEEGVSPDNWRELTVGHVQNVRRGVGPDDGFLFADLVIKDPDAIEAVRAGKREVSCGYDCEYEQTGDGAGRQYNIVGNHVALVEKGRCGPRCAIKDHSPKEILDMSKKKLTVRDRLMRLLGAKDEGEFNEMLNRPDTDAVENAPAPEAGASEGAASYEIHNHIHLPGGGEPLVGTGDEPDPAAVAAEGVPGEEPGTGDDPADLPPWFLEHVSQNNARFDRIEAMLSKLAPQDDDDPVPAEADPDADLPADGIDPEIEQEIAGADESNVEGVDTPPGTGDEDPEEVEDESNVEGVDTPPGTGDEDPEEAEEAEEVEDEVGPAPDKPVGDSARRLAAKGKKGKKGKKAKVTDSAPLSAAYQATVALAEIIAPGIKLPTFDSKAAPKKTFDAICALRRRALDSAYRNPETTAIVRSINGGPLKLKSMSCGAVRVLFRAVGNSVKTANDAALQVVNNGAGGGLGVNKDRKIKSIADINKLNAERYSGGTLH